MLGVWPHRAGRVAPPGGLWGRNLPRHGHGPGGQVPLLGWLGAVGTEVDDALRPNQAKRKRGSGIWVGV